MSKKLQLQIPTPCHENWDHMSPVEKGRFCDSCQKQVVDFSRMSDREVAMFFKKPSTGSVCGRFMEDQLNRAIEIPGKRIPWLKYFFQFLLPGFLLSCTGRTIGKVKVTGEPKTEQHVSSNEIPIMLGQVMPDTRVDTLPVVADTSFVDLMTVKGDIEVREYEITNPGSISLASKKNELVLTGEIKDKGAGSDSGFLNGRVINDKGEGIPFATVTVDNNEVVTDSLGNYSYRLTIHKPNITIKASSAGYFSKEVAIDAQEATINQDIVLKANDVLKEVVVASMMLTGQVKKSIVSGQVCQTLGYVIPSTIVVSRQLPDPSADIYLSKFKLYPNPVVRGQEFKIEFLSQQRSNLVIRLTAADGKVIVQKEVKVEEGLQQLAISTDSKWAAGSYFIQLLSNSDKPILQKQVVIQ